MNVKLRVLQNCKFFVAAFEPEVVHQRNLLFEHYFRFWYELVLSKLKAFERAGRVRAKCRHVSQRKTQKERAFLAPRRNAASSLLAPATQTQNCCRKGCTTLQQNRATQHPPGGALLNNGEEKGSRGTVKKLFQISCGIGAIL